MTQSERYAVLKAEERIANLASLQNASFSMNEEKNKEIKGEINLYMQWFDSVSMRLIDLCLADETGDKHSKKQVIEDIMRYLD